MLDGEVHSHGSGRLGLLLEVEGHWLILFRPAHVVVELGIVDGDLPRMVHAEPLGNMRKVGFILHYWRKNQYKHSLIALKILKERFKKDKASL
jgi:hypothetical protein